MVATTRMLEKYISKRGNFLDRVEKRVVSGGDRKHRGRKKFYRKGKFGIWNPVI